MKAATPSTRRVSFDWIARPYRWLEYLSFGPALEQCRFLRIPQLHTAQRALVLGDGDGRFLARLLRTFPRLEVDAVDESAAMLQLTRRRLQKVASGSAGPLRARLFEADALAFPLQGRYDLVISHFFLDCLDEAQCSHLMHRLRPHLAPHAMWLISEFGIPEGTLAAPLARAVISGLYRAFGLLTGLQSRRLPDYARELSSSGWCLQNQQALLQGLLRSELWSWRVPHPSDVDSQEVSALRGNAMGALGVTPT